jgi:hypothetical protein
MVTYVVDDGIGGREVQAWVEGLGPQSTFDLGDVEVSPPEDLPFDPITTQDQQGERIRLSPRIAAARADAGGRPISGVAVRLDRWARRLSNSRITPVTRETSSGRKGRTHDAV